jgi:hypothetical protein
MDIRKLLGDSSFETKSIIIDVVETQINEKIPIEQILSEVVSFLSTQLSMNEQKELLRIKEQIYKGMQQLENLNQWSSLNALAQQSTKARNRAFRSDQLGNKLSDINRMFQFQEKVMELCVTEMNKLFNQETIDKVIKGD